MSQLADIEAAQKNLEECFAKRMGELEAQIQGSVPSKDTVAKVAEEFRTFRELIFSMLGLLRRQIVECSSMVDSMETRHRRKAIIISGVPETANEDCMKLVLGIVNNKLAIADTTAQSVTVCHRLGSPSKERHRPILVRFSKESTKAAVWKSKTKLKGSSITIREFLTKGRQATFAQARLHFGMRSCWTQDGVIVVLAPDGTRHKVITTEQLNCLVTKYPKSVSTAKSTSASAKVSSRAK